MKQLRNFATEQVPTTGHEQPMQWSIMATSRRLRRPTGRSRARPPTGVVNRPLLPATSRRRASACGRPAYDTCGGQPAVSRHLRRLAYREQALAAAGLPRAGACGGWPATSRHLQWLACHEQMATVAGMSQAGAYDSRPAARSRLGRPAGHEQALWQPAGHEQALWRPVGREQALRRPSCV
ncbi:uncharacterized protein LOC122010692 [Zingiber officinale]|uniref:uncharacterized protein LOC122010692 n=1 Tax=Zingiber officinale TaxID=94328 RepID=UPI001C4CFA57|nr:uncharacterized protein LOC122010692 [Zingiber officinale]